MAVASYVYVYEEGITETYDMFTTPNITVVSSLTPSTTFGYMGTTSVGNKVYAQFMTSNVSSATISTLDAFEGITVELPIVGDTYEIYVDLQKKDLYAWYGIAGFSEAKNWYTITQTPTTSDYVYDETGLKISAGDIDRGNFLTDTPITSTDLSANPPTITISYSNLH